MHSSRGQQRTGTGAGRRARARGSTDTWIDPPRTQWRNACGGIGGRMAPRAARHAVL